MKLGVLAGNRNLPFTFCQSVKEKDSDIELIAFCFYGETDRSIQRVCDKAYWLHVGELEALTSIMRKENLRKMVMVGQITPQRIFQRRFWDEKMLRLTEDIEDFRPHTVFTRLIRTLEVLGITFIDSTIYIQQLLANEGVMNDVSTAANVWEDIEFGLRIISRYVELDVGQSIAVKKKTVVSLEALEGTDNTIRRAHVIAGKGCVVLKFSKKDQDLRFDVPLVGLNTLTLLKRIKAAALVLEKNKVIILEKEKFLERARKWNIPIIGKAKT